MGSPTLIFFYFFSLITKINLYLKKIKLKNVPPQHTGGKHFKIFSEGLDDKGPSTADRSIE